MVVVVVVELQYGVSSGGGGGRVAVWSELMHVILFPRYSFSLSSPSSPTPASRGIITVHDNSSAVVCIGRRLVELLFCFSK